MITKYCSRTKTMIAVAAAALFSNFANAEQTIGSEPAVPLDDITFLGEYARATVSPNGNVFQFESPAGYEHINVGAVLEGYLLCYNQTGSPQAKWWDYYTFDNGGFSAATFLPDANFSQRSTIDNKVLLTQTFTFSNRNNQVVINMKVKNKTAQNLTNVVVRRQVDLDTDTGGALGWAGFINTHGADLKDTVIAYNASSRPPAGRSAHTMLLSHIDATPRSRVSRLAKVTVDIGNTDCEPANLNGGEASLGDHGDTIEYKIPTLGPGQSMNIKVALTRPGANGL